MALWERADANWKNLLDSSQSISVTERQSYILKLRTMSNKIAESYIEIRKDLGFPLDKKQYEKWFIDWSRNRRPTV